MKTLMLLVSLTFFSLIPNAHTESKHGSDTESTARAEGENKLKADSKITSYLKNKVLPPAVVDKARTQEGLPKYLLGKNEEWNAKYFADYFPRLKNDEFTEADKAAREWAKASSGTIDKVESAFFARAVCAFEIMKKASLNQDRSCTDIQPDSADVKQADVLKFAEEFKQEFAKKEKEAEQVEKLLANVRQGDTVAAKEVEKLMNSDLLPEYLQKRVKSSGKEGELARDLALALNKANNGKIPVYNHETGKLGLISGTPQQTEKIFGDEKEFKASNWGSYVKGGVDGKNYTAFTWEGGTTVKKQINNVARNSNSSSNSPSSATQSVGGGGGGGVDAASALKILTTNCAPCHTLRDDGGFKFTDVASLKGLPANKKQQIVDSVSSNPPRMPKGGKLSAGDIESLKSWVKGLTI